MSVSVSSKKCNNKIGPIQRCTSHITLQSNYDVTNIHSLNIRKNGKKSNPLKRFTNTCLKKLIGHSKESHVSSIFTHENSCPPVLSTIPSIDLTSKQLIKQQNKSLPNIEYWIFKVDHQSKCPVTTSNLQSLEDVIDLSENEDNE